MDKQENERDNSDRRNSNTEYIPTKCRITKPPPPKPATNPLQFVKVAPCPLFQKAQEQIKKVEEIKKERKEIRDETEDWQQNLDNWKSSRRKQQEHIIERVVEVKKLTEQEELEKARRKSKTFSEMIDERNRGRHKFSIPIYNDDDSNDLSDYGIGSSSSKTNSVKDNDTDDSCSILDEKDNHSFDSPSNKDTSSASNQSQSEDETNHSSDKIKDRLSTLNNNNNSKIFSSTYTTTLSTPNTKPAVLPKTRNYLESKSYSTDSTLNDTNQQYTYEGAIQDYRSRIQSKIKVDESIFTKNAISKSKEYSEAQVVLPKGEISKRKGLFEPDKPLEINHMETTSSRRLSEDFANSISIKDRLKSLEKSSDQSIKSVDKNDIQILSVKQRLQNLNKQNVNDTQNNNVSRPNKISSYLLDKSNSTPTFETKKLTSTLWTSDNSERCSSPETEMYMNKLDMFSRDLDNLIGDKADINDYAPSVASVELTGIFSDREDSGIHTADVSCSVSQADEPIDTDNETLSTTIPSCIEKLKSTKETQAVLLEEDFTSEDNMDTKLDSDDTLTPYVKEELIQITKDFLSDLIKHASENIAASKSDNLEKTERNIEPKTVVKVQEVIPETVPEKISKPPAIYENVELKPYTNFVMDEPFSLTPPKMEPPKVKPPPPPPPEDIVETSPPKPIKRINSTKRIKQEMHIKRSSFLGLDDQNIDFDPDMLIEKPPDLQYFLQKESKLEKSLFKKMQEENRCGILSKVESQDSGLDIDRGRLSSDTWCSSIGDSSTPSHERQDSEHTNSITSEEDEITKKEREIIEMVEKEEKTRDNIEYVTQKQPPSNVLSCNKKDILNTGPSLGSEEFNNPYFPQINSDFMNEQDSEVLKVEHELRQLEKEELERQRENMLFRESRAKARLQNNRHSLENLCDEIYPCYENTTIEYRKSMPELEYRKSVTDLPSTYYQNMPDTDIQYRKSMPDIQRAYQKSTQTEHKNANLNRKSMPELQHDAQRSAFKSPPPVNRQPIMPGKPIRTIKEPIIANGNGPSTKTRPLSKHSLHALSAVPRQRHNDNWIQLKANPEAKSYNQHWVFQEAELRRLSDQQKNASRNWQQPRHEKHLPESIIQSLTQRVQNRTNVNDRNPPLRRSDGINKDYIQHPYLGHPQSMGHALPTVPYSPPLAVDEPSQDRMLSVSGKKKCSYCGNELGRGAAMIIESLCLFYHMECFKCCVCHIQLGDGRMGTDVRVRNQKLHCHNCYSSDDGVKFSCV